MHPEGYAGYGTGVAPQALTLVKSLWKALWGICSRQQQSVEPSPEPAAVCSIHSPFGTSSVLNKPSAVAGLTAQRMHQDINRVKGILLNCSYFISTSGLHSQAPTTEACQQY